MSREQIRYSVLGPVRAWLPGAEIELGSPRQRTVLVALLLELNRPVSLASIIDAVWGQEPPRDARNCVYTYVSRLRRAMRPAEAPEGKHSVLFSTKAGYQLAGDPGRVDVVAFEQQCATARDCYRRGDKEAAAAAISAAMSLWGGEPFGGLAGPRVEAERVRLAELHLAALELLAEIRLDGPEAAEVAAELSALVREYPLRERLRELLMLALYRAGRQGDALRAFQDLRAVLTEDLGVEPGPAIQQLHQRILAADPALSIADEAGPHPAFPVPHQLPAITADFVGRDTQLHQLNRLLANAGGNGGTVVISAIDGTAGIGKTALALHWAHHIAGQFPGGQLYLNMRGFDPSGTPVRPVNALHAFLEALGVARERIPATLESRAALYRSVLAERQVLVVLDNARDVTQVRPLLPARPGCLVVVTSRNRLVGLVAQEGAHPLTLDALSTAEATALLARRLGSGRVAAEPQAVAELISGCGGLPLALAIVAARAAAHPHLPLAALAAELSHTTARLDVLDAGEPYTSLRTVLSWSAQALEPPIAEVFGLLGLAPGADISLAAAASLIAQPVTRTRAILLALENAHLLRQDSPGRYRMHDLVRLYAAEHARQTLSPGTRPAALSRLTGFYLHTSHAAERLLAPHRPAMSALSEPVDGCHPLDLAGSQAAWAWFEAEHECVVAAAHQAAAEGWHSAVWRLAWTLDTFYRRQGRLSDRVATWRMALIAAERVGELEALRLAHLHLGEANSAQGSHSDAFTHLGQALTLAEDAADVPGQGHIHSVLTLAWERQGTDSQALAHATQALHLYQADGNSVLAARALSDMGWFHARLGNHAEAQAHCEAALDLHRRHSDQEAVGATLDTLGYVAHHTGDHVRALGYLHEAVAVFRELGDSHQEADILNVLAEAHAALGQQRQAIDAWEQALLLYRTQHRSDGIERIQKRLASPAQFPASLA